MWDIVVFAILCGIYVGLFLYCVLLKCGTNVGFGRKAKKNQCGIHVRFLLAPRPNFHFFYVVCITFILTGEWMMQG